MTSGGRFDSPWTAAGIVALGIATLVALVTFGTGDAPGTPTPASESESVAEAGTLSDAGTDVPRDAGVDDAPATTDAGAELDADASVDADTDASAGLDAALDDTRPLPPISLPQPLLVRMDTPTENTKTRCTTHFVAWEGLRQSQPEEHRIRIIATIPSATLAYAHEGAVRAINLAAERSGFAIEQTWPPPDADQDCESWTPTAMHFRLTDDVGEERNRLDWLDLMLVAEDPGAGVEATAFTIALDQFPDGAEIPLIGPSYSGSAPSLARLLTTREVEAFVGSATAPNLEAILAPPHRDPALPPHTLHRLSASDDALQRLFFEYLRDAQGMECDGPVLPGVGVLRESGTGWGAMGTHAATHPPCSPQVELTFPYQISELRRVWSEYEARLDREAASDAPAPMRPLVSIASDFVDDTDQPTAGARPMPHDIVQSMVSGLDRLLAEVAHARLRYIGIQATDPADAIFLADRVHDLAPDARVFMLGNDALFSHHSSREEMDGTYVVSSYPFLGTDDFWMQQPFRIHQTFMSDAAEATFNATVSAIESRRHHAQAVGDVQEAEVTFCHAVEQPYTMPVWLGVMSVDGFEPIWLGHARPPGADTRGDPLVDEDCQLQLDPDVVPPNLWLVLVLLIGAGVELDRRRVRKLLKQLGLANRTAPVPADDPMGAIIIVTCAWSRLVWYVIAACVIVVHAASMLSVYGGSARLWAGLVAVVFAVVPRAWNGRSKGSALRQLLRVAHMRGPIMYVVAGWSALVVADLVWLVSRAAVGHSEGPLFAMRAVALATGTSPLVPLLMTLLATWILTVCQGNVLAELRGESPDAHRRLLADLLGEKEAPKKAGNEPRRPGTGNRIDDAEHDVRHSVLGEDAVLRRLYFAAGLIVPPAFIAGFIKHPSSLEPWVAGGVLAANGLFALAYLVFLLLELRDYHGAFVRLLDRVGRRPVAGLFHKLPSAFAWTVDRMLSADISRDARIPMVQEMLGGTFPELWATAKQRGHEAWEGATLVEPTVVGTPDGDAAPSVSWKTDLEGEEHEAMAARKERTALPLAALVAIILSRLVRVTRHYFLGLTAGGLCLLAAISFYPFQPRHYFLLCAWLVIGCTATACIWVFVDLDRTTVLSRIGRSAPGRLALDSGFFLRLTTYALVPLLSLLASQYPSYARRLFEVFAPFLRVLR